MGATGSVPQQRPKRQRAARQQQHYERYPGIRLPERTHPATTTTSTTTATTTKFATTGNTQATAKADEPSSWQSAGARRAQSGFHRQRVHHVGVDRHSHYEQQQQHQQQQRAAARTLQQAEPPQPRLPVLHYNHHHHLYHYDPSVASTTAAFRRARSRTSSVATLTTADMESTSRWKPKGSSSGKSTLLDQKCYSYGRFHARQLSARVFNNLRESISLQKPIRTRLRLSTKGLTVGSKGNSAGSIFRSLSQGATYEFIPLSNIHEMVVDSKIQKLLIVVRDHPGGFHELLTYMLENESTARIYQSTFNDMVGVERSTQFDAIDGGRTVSSGRVIESSSSHAARSGGGTLRSNAYGGYHHSTGTTSKSGGTLTRGWPTTQRAYLYRLRQEEIDDGAMSSMNRHDAKIRHRSEGDMLDGRLRREMSDYEFMAQMRQRGELRDINDNDEETDGPVHLVFNRNGPLELHGAEFGPSIDAELYTDEIDGGGGGGASSDRDSGIHSKDHGSPEVVDRGVGTVRAKVTDYRMSTSSSAADHVDYSTSTARTTQNQYGNGYVSTMRGRSPTRTGNSGHIVHQVLPGRAESPSPSHRSRGAQSESGWRTRLPWGRRSRSSDSKPQAEQRWETASLMVGGKPRPMATVAMPQGKSDLPEYILMVPPTLGRRGRTQSARRLEL